VPHLGGESDNQQTEGKMGIIIQGRKKGACIDKKDTRGQEKGQRKKPSIPFAEGRGKGRERILGGRRQHRRLINDIFGFKRRIHSLR